ncbi:MAG: phenylalanine--tRNA ligase subunit beta [Candidatus Aminicenantia bacterium]
MKVSINWLKELVEIEVDPEELTSRLRMVGIGVEGIERWEDDYIFNLEITTNRPDCLGHIGVAREISAIFNKPLKIPEISYAEEDEEALKIVNVEILDRELCPRYCGVVIRDFKVGPSPEKIRKRLESLGLRSINNAVDITNYVLLLTGHPVHAFDLKKIKGNKIIIRKAKKGESLLTLDGVMRNLDEETLVIADEILPVAIAGVIGGEESGVKDDTKDIFLESAYFNPISIRRTSKRLGISTEASYRFERGVDWNIPSYSARLCATLFHEMGGKIAKGLIDVFPEPIKIFPVQLRSDKLSELTGVEIPEEFVEDILKKLGFEILSSKKENFKIFWDVLPTTFRGDVKEEADLIEEVVRFYGYEKIPSSIPEISLNDVYLDLKRERINSIIELLSIQGWNEVITFSFIDPEDECFSYEGESISIMNPISSRFSRMRRSFLPGILRTVSLNLSRNVEGGRIFEIGKVFWKEKEIVERNRLALAYFGKSGRKWVEEKEYPLFSMKGILSLLLSYLGYKNHRFEETDSQIYQKYTALSIIVDEKKIGTVGKIDYNILKKFSIDRDVYYCEISIDELFELETSQKPIQPPPRFPSVKRDLSFLISKEIQYSKVERAIKMTGIEELEEFFLWDLFRGGEIPEDKLSMTVGFLFRAKDRTLTHDEVDEMMERIGKTLQENFDVQIRGKDAG